MATSNVCEVADVLVGTEAQEEEEGEVEEEEGEEED